MTELDERIRKAYGPAAVDEAEREGIWQAALDTAPQRTSRKRRRRSRRGLVVVVAVGIVSLGSVAVAQPELARDLIFGEDDPNRPVTRMEVFEQARTPENTSGLEVFDEPVDGKDTSSQMLRRDFFRGLAGFGHELLPREYMRTLLHRRFGRYSISIVAVPTTEGKVCYTVWTTRLFDKPGFASRDAGALGSCVEAFDDERPIKGGAGLNEAGQHVVGLASDDVVEVRVELFDGRRHDAVIGTNAYYWQGGREDRPHRVVAVMRDGRTVEHSVMGVPVPGGTRTDAVGAATADPRDS